MLVTYNKYDGTANIQCTLDEADKMRELLNLFSAVPLTTIVSMLNSDAGRLAYAVLCSETDTAPVRMLIDELQQSYLSSESTKAFISRQALMNELEDVLRAKSITPYRRSRINKALKRECLKCHGSGKQVRVVKGDSQFPALFGGSRKIRHEIDSRSPDCDHCKGTGINPKEETVTLCGVTLTKAELEGIQELGNQLSNEQPT